MSSWPARDVARVARPLPVAGPLPGGRRLRPVRERGRSPRSGILKSSAPAAMRRPRSRSASTRGSCWRGWWCAASALERVFSERDAHRGTQPTPARGRLSGAIAVVRSSIFPGRAAGFVVASAGLFWLTARAFDDRRPGATDLWGGLSVGAYLLFARVLSCRFRGHPRGLAVIGTLRSLLGGFAARSR